MGLRQGADPQEPLILLLAQASDPDPRNLPNFSPKFPSCGTIAPTPCCATLEQEASFDNRIPRS